MAKKKKSHANLVSQYLEGISRTALAEYQQFFKDVARRRNGVYALYKKKRLYYVGLARDLRARLKGHLRDRHSESWDRFSLYLTIGDQHIKELESLVLRIVKPEGNRQVGRFSKAENLRRRLTGIVRQDNSKRLAILLGKELSGAERLKRKGRRAADKSRPVLANYANRPVRLRAVDKGKTLKARVRRDGSISFGGNRFTSPSTAASHAIRGRRAINGWHFWKYERAPGDWVRLRELRR
jgi:hypothetical protein